MKNELKEVFVFSDWSSINQIKNQKDSTLKADSSVITEVDKETGDRCIRGYVITIYNHPYILCRVTLGLSPWSLSETQIVEMLNAYGFSCKYEEPPYALKSYQKNILVSLQVLGYTHVIRTCDEGQGRVLALLTSKDYNNQILDFSTDIRASQKYNYYDWVFLPLGRSVSIEKLLNLPEEKEEIVEEETVEGAGEESIIL